MNYSQFTQSASKGIIVFFLLATCAAGYSDKIYVVAGALKCFESSNPGKAIYSDLGAFDRVSGDRVNLVGITFRPGDHALLGVDTKGQLYNLAINQPFFEGLPATYAIPVGPAVSLPMAGSSFGVDANPDTSDVRTVSDQELNIEQNAYSGFMTAGASINPPGNIVGIAYMPSPGGATLYGIDSDSNMLVKIGGDNGTPSADTGTVTPVGPVGLDFDEFSSIGATSQTLYALLRVNGVQGLYTLNPATGAVENSLGSLTGFTRGEIAVDASGNGIDSSQRLFDAKLSAKLNFKKPGSDTINFSATLPAVPENVVIEGSVVNLNLEGITRTFTLDRSGKAKSGNDAIKIKAKVSKDGSFASAVSFSISLKRGDFEPQLALPGLINENVKNQPSAVDVSVTMFGQEYKSTVPLFYTAKLGKTGKAKSRFTP